MTNDLLVIPSRKNKLKVRRLSDVPAEELKWLWFPYIPAGKVTMLEGDPGLGKSYITCAIAAAISTGRCLPGQTQCLAPQGVLMMSAEDDLGDTVRPRILALGGNLANIAVTDNYFILDRLGLKDLEETIRETAVTIAFLDPIVSYMGGKIDMNKANEVRTLMGPLNEVARNTGTAIIAVRHLRKDSGKGGKAIYRGIGSIDFTAAARSVLQVEERDGVKYIIHAKHNLSQEGKTLSYKIEDQVFKWGQFSEPRGRGRKPRPPSPLIAEIQEKMRTLLSEGPRPANEMLEALAKYKRKPIFDAKRNFVASTRLSDGAWMWELVTPPDTPTEPAGAFERAGDSVTPPVASDEPATPLPAVATPSVRDPSSVASVGNGVAPRVARQQAGPIDLTLPDFLDRALQAARAKLGSRPAAAI